MPASSTGTKLESDPSQFGNPDSVKYRHALEALETICFGDLATDFAGGSVPFIKMLALREIDRNYYRSVMRLWSRFGPDPSASNSAEVRMALMGSQIAQSLLAPAVARQFLGDAIEWTSSVEQRDSIARFDVVLAAARLEIDSGSMLAAEKAAAEAQRIAVLIGNEIDVDRLNRLDVAKVRLADSQLDDAGAAQSINAAVKRRAGDPKGLSMDSRSSDVAVQTLLIEHLQGRLCSGCDTMLAGAMETWLNLCKRPSQSLGPLGLQMALLASTAKSAAVTARARATAVQILRDGHQVAEGYGFTDKFWVKDRESNDRLRAVATTMANSLMETAGDSLFAAILDKDIRSKRKTFEAYALGSAAEMSNMGASEGALHVLDELARLMQAADLSLSARVMTEQLVSLAYEDHDAENGGWVAPDATARLQLARILPPAHARLGNYAYQDKNWAEANKQLDASKDLILRRMRQEWRAGNARAAQLFRTFRPALALVAQTRMLLAMEPDARRALPDVDEAAWGDLQLAMAGENALTMQAAISRKIIGDGDLANAIAERDAAMDKIAQIEELEKFGKSKLPWRTEAAVAQARATIERTSKLIDESLAASGDFASIDPVPLDATIARLASDEALLVLHSGTRQLYGMVARRGAQPLIFKSALPAEQLAETVKQMRQQAASFGSIDLEATRALFDGTIGPVSALLDGVSHLIVVGDGATPGIPWGMLTTAEANVGADFGAAGTATRGIRLFDKSGKSTKPVNWSAIPWLIRKFPVSVSTSVRSLVTQRDGSIKSAATKPFLGVGDPILEGETPIEQLNVAAVFTRSGSVDAQTLSSLAPLPETADELAALASSLGGDPSDLLLRDRATETGLRGLSLGDYRVIMFATHGILAGELSGWAEPGLVLSPEQGIDGADGYLSLSEIMSMRLDADLVILSACNTAGADGRPRAEWMSGLARGFVGAGARQLIVTLWSIPSEPTTRLMTGMARTYAEQPDRSWSRALQLAVLASIDTPAFQSDAHPGSWAAFSMLGAGDGVRH